MVGSFELDIDGERLVTQPDTRTAPASGYDTLEVGIAWSDSTQDPIDLQIDELAIDDQPIPCDP